MKHGLQALKAEIQQLKSSQSSSVGPSAIPPSPPAPADELESRLASYQQFLAQYIVNAQNQKLLAIKEAELNAEKKFQERLEKLFANSGVALPPSTFSDVTAVSVVEPTLFQQRNTKMIAAAEAGKSRWGSMEVERAVEQYKDSPAMTNAATVKVAEPTLFQRRTAKVIAAADAGKSRWGSMEVERAKNSGVAVVIAPSSGSGATVEKSMEKVTLEDRVNLGARLLGV